MSLAALRSEFPILERVAYLNAGTDGPVPRAAQEAAAREVAAEVEEGRAFAHFERRSSCSTSSAPATPSCSAARSTTWR